MLHRLEFSSIQYADGLPAVCNVFYVDSEVSASSFRNSLLVSQFGQRDDSGTQVHRVAEKTV